MRVKHLHSQVFNVSFFKTTSELQFSGKLIYLLGSLRLRCSIRNLDTIPFHHVNKNPDIVLQFSGH